MSGDVRLTEGQWTAVRTVDRHLLVAAGAGTGKTFTVVQKILYLLGIPVHGETVEHPLTLREIAAITYTNAAATELKERLRAALRAAGLRDLAHEVDAARIGTIHAFCGDVLAEFSLRMGRAPSRVLEEGEARALLSECAGETLVGAVQHGVPGAPKEDVDALLGAWSVRDVTEWIEELAGDIGRLGHILSDCDVLEPRERTLAMLAGDAHGRFVQALDRRGAMDFDHMIAWTLELLEGEDGSALRALRKRIRVLIVDEFQDVDPLQKEIVYKLGDPRAGDAAATRLVLVGDPKQSIYRFRRADASIWREVARDFEGGAGAVVELDVSRRSVDSILAFADASVGAILDTPLDGVAPQAFEAPHQRLVAHRTDRPDPSGVEIIAIPPADADGVALKADDQRLVEAEAVARRVADLLRDGAARDDGLRANDVALLFASWGAVEHYASALERRGVPTRIVRTDGFWSRREVVDLVLALEAIRDPRDDRALLGFLRSPFVCAKDETLLAIARQCAHPYREHLEALDCAESDVVRRGVALLARFAALRDRVPAAELLDTLLEESGYLAHLVARGGDDGMQALANVRQLVRLVRGMEGASVGTVLRDIAERRRRGDRAGDAPLFAPGDPRVTLTSIHSAKGLDWRVVFWCDLCRGAPGANERMLVHASELVLAEPDVEAKEQRATFTELRERIERECEAERKRLWYVAATRAKDLLVLSGLPLGKTRTNTPAHALLAALGLESLDGVREVPYSGRSGVGYRATVQVADATLSASVEDDAGAEEAASRLERWLDDGEAGGAEVEIAGAPAGAIAAAAGRARHSATELLAWTRCRRRHWFKYVVGVPEPEARAGAGGSAPFVATADAATAGDIVHEVLERMEEDEELDRLLDDAITRHEDAVPVSARGVLKARLAEELRRVAASPEYQAVAGRPGARRELPFLHIAGDGRVAHGRIDLAAAAEDGLVLLDVKTGSCDAARARGKALEYGPQREVYTSAVEEISGLAVSRFAFHFTAAGHHDVTAVTDALRAEAAERMRGLAAAGRDRPGLAASADACRGCGYRAVGWCEGVS